MSEKYTNERVTKISFKDLGLSGPILQLLDEIGYENPTPIQAAIIPHIHAGDDVLGQSQTGTGKTAAFALPLLMRVKLNKQVPQILVLVPTRELALQVTEAFKVYATHMKGIRIFNIYGGQDYNIQLKELKRGLHVVVGTPGRVMDHMRRGTLKLDDIECLILDEADEMLRMGFIDDVEWILEQTPEDRQLALFSATMPPAIEKIAKQYLKDPEKISIGTCSSAAKAIRQRFWEVSGVHKFEALTRILEVEDYDGMIIFVRTQTATLDLAKDLEAAGFSTAALNGAVPQKQREQTVEKLKSGEIDILIATDVAARGLDVDRITHVINYDIPFDTESYVHRIGRTGRAGRSGEAILFVSPRERYILRNIERSNKQKMELLELPTAKAITERRIARLKRRISDTISSQNIASYIKLIDDYAKESDIPLINVAAALASLLQENAPLFKLEDPKVSAKISYKEPRKEYRRDSNNRDKERDGRFRERKATRDYEDKYDKPRGENRRRDGAGRGKGSSRDDAPRFTKDKDRRSFRDFKDKAGSREGRVLKKKSK